MKKIYTIVFLSVFSLGLFAQESILSLSLYDLSSTNLNMSHTDIKKNVIKLETIDSQNGGTSDFFYAKTSGNPLDCVGGTPAPSTIYVFKRLIINRFSSVFILCGTYYGTVDEI